MGFPVRLSASADGAPVRRRPVGTRIHERTRDGRIWRANREFGKDNVGKLASD